MNLLKKLLCSVLLATALLTSIQISTAHASTNTTDETILVDSSIDTLSAGPLTFHHWESGTVVVNSGNHYVYGLNGIPRDTYYPGESFYYDRVYTSITPIGVHYFVAYENRDGDISLVQTSIVNNSGVKTYVPGLTIY